MPHSGNGRKGEASRLSALRFVQSPWTCRVLQTSRVLLLVLVFVPLSFCAADKPHVIARHVVCLIEVKLP